MSFDLNDGAQPVKRVIQQMVEKEVAMGVLREDFTEEDMIIVDDDDSPQVREEEDKREKGSFIANCKASLEFSSVAGANLWWFL
ncbi:hypothetical protein T459_28289 [Capsicum annuum]|uniref:Uncharacterized protein n=1 Tax=Capsicum annuum TaxID=4072 RepID=A0A2G2YGC8_CAPAN|nr:hypothetical protein T459_28289 [Capsicum annuum]